MKARWLKKTQVLITPTPRAETVMFIFLLSVQVLIIDTDVHMEQSDDDTMDVQSKPKPKMIKRVCPRPVTKNSQSQAKVPNVADSDQHDLATDKGSSTQKSNHIGKFLFPFLLWY